jgi:transcriptional regulator with XRE-family HTH domain
MHPRNPPMSDPSDKPHMGSRIKEARDRAGMTQTALAAATGVQSWTISRWESGGQIPGGDRLKTIAAALGVTPDWLTGATAAERVDVLADNEMLAAVREMTGATDEELRWLASSPRFHRATVGSLIDALRADRQGMTPEQAAASREATERHRDPSVPRRPRR